MQDLNLLPQEELSAQTEVKAVKLSTIFSILFLVIIAGVSGYLYYRDYNHKKEMEALGSNIVSLQSEIQSMASVEVKARNLDKKYFALTQIFSKQKVYSKLLKEIRYRQPLSVDISEFNLRISQIDISGTADNYISIAELINNLLNKKFSGGVSGLEGLFTSVSLNSVSMDETQNNIRYFIVVSFNEELLK